MYSVWCGPKGGGGGEGGYVMVHRPKPLPVLFKNT